VCVYSQIYIANNQLTFDAMRTKRHGKYRSSKYSIGSFGSFVRVCYYDNINNSDNTPENEFSFQEHEQNRHIVSTTIWPR